ncbi:hypothetical protein RCL1_007384 [Eukaryota sp. TZLM3-RCL]
MSSDDLKSRVDALRRQVVTLQLYALGNDSNSAVTLRTQILNECKAILASVNADSSFLDSADPSDPSSFTPDVSLICRIRRAISSAPVVTKKPLQQSNLIDQQQEHSSKPSAHLPLRSPSLSPSMSPQRIHVPRPEPEPLKSSLSKVIPIHPTETSRLSSTPLPIPNCLFSPSCDNSDEHSPFEKSPSLESLASPSPPSNLIDQSKILKFNETNTQKLQKFSANYSQDEFDYKNDVDAKIFKLDDSRPNFQPNFSKLDDVHSKPKNLNENFDANLHHSNSNNPSREVKRTPRQFHDESTQVNLIPKQSNLISVSTCTELLSQSIDQSNFQSNLMEDDVLSLRAAIITAREYLENLESLALEMMERLNNQSKSIKKSLKVTKQPTHLEHSNNRKSPPTVDQSNLIDQLIEVKRGANVRSSYLSPEILTRNFESFDGFESDFQHDDESMKISHEKFQNNYEKMTDNMVKKSIQKKESPVEFNPNQRQSLQSRTSTPSIRQSKAQPSPSVSSSVDDDVINQSNLQSNDVIEARKRAAKRAVERKRKEKQEEERRKRQKDEENQQKAKEREERIKEFNLKEKSRSVSRSRLSTPSTSPNPSNPNPSNPKVTRNVTVDLSSVKPKKVLKTVQMTPKFQSEISEEELRIFEQIEKQLVG